MHKHIFSLLKYLVIQYQKNLSHVFDPHGGKYKIAYIHTYRI